MLNLKVNSNTKYLNPVQSFIFNDTNTSHNSSLFKAFVKYDAEVTLKLGPVSVQHDNL